MKIGDLAEPIGEAKQATPHGCRYLGEIHALEDGLVQVRFEHVMDRAHHFGWFRPDELRITEWPVPVRREGSNE